MAAEFIKLQGYEVFAFANCVEAGRAILLCNNSTHYLLVHQLNPDDEEAPLEESFRYEPVLTGELMAYGEALKAMIALAIRR